MDEKVKVVILCGGEGTRLREETEYKPKPMVLIGGRPILWHIMKIYSHYGFKEFILCLGYKGEMIRDYFLKHNLMHHDFTLNLAQKKQLIHHDENDFEDWSITFVETGQDTNTGGRIKKIEKYIDGNEFMLTYGDGVADINLHKLLEHHKKHNKIVTLTSIQPMSRFGVVEFDEKHHVTSFKEKPKLDGWINGGFFVCNRKVFDYIRENDVFEQAPLINLARERQLVAYLHEGSWECMDTYRDFKILNNLWNSDGAFWKVWK